MILPFSTQLNGKATCFPEKIINGLFDGGIIDWDKASALLNPMPFERNGNFHVILFEGTKPTNGKIHTIREDITHRWCAGVMIDFYINNRKPDMFQFAPQTPCTATQKIEILNMGEFPSDVPLSYVIYTPMIDEGEDYEHEQGYAIYVEGKLLSMTEAEDLAANDGFDSIEDFFKYFNSDFEGKIIHWTDKRY